MTSLNIKTLVLLSLGFLYIRTDSFLCTLGCPPLPTSGCPPGQPWAGGIMLSHHCPPGRSAPTTVVKGKPRQIPPSCSASLSPSALSLLYVAAPFQQGMFCMVGLNFAWPGGLWAQLGLWTSNRLDVPSSSNPFFSLDNWRKKIRGRNWLKSELCLSTPPPYWIDISFGQRQALSNGDHSSDDL